MQTSSPRTFNAFIILAVARRSCARFFNGRASSQLTATLATTLLARDPRIGDPHSYYYAGPGSASLGVSPRRHDCYFGQLRACQHTAQKWIMQLHRLFLRTHEYHSVVISSHMSHQDLADCEVHTPIELLVFIRCNDVYQVERLLQVHLS